MFQFIARRSCAECLKQGIMSKYSVTARVDSKTRTERESMIPWENGRTDLSPFS